QVEQEALPLDRLAGLGLLAAEQVVAALQVALVVGPGQAHHGQAQPAEVVEQGRTVGGHHSPPRVVLGLSPAFRRSWRGPRRRAKAGTPTKRPSSVRLTTDNFQSTSAARTPTPPPAPAAAPPAPSPAAA